MKKSWLSLFIGIVACLLLSSCGVPSPPNENDIAQSIPEDIRTVIIDNPFDATNSDIYIMDVQSVSIEKRQTNEKKDTAYCIIELENDYYRFTKSIITYYNYYDKGGWILDNYSEYNPTTWEIKKCPFISDEIAGLISDYRVIDAKGPVIDTSSGTVSFTFDVNDEYENVTSKGSIDVLLVFDGSRWAYDINTDNINLNWNILGHWYSSIYSGIYLDINELTNDSMSVEVIYEDTAEDALTGNKGVLFDVSDERYWHLTTQSTDMWEKYTDQGEPYLHFQFDFDAWGDLWNIYILKDSAFAKVRMYPITELYRVASNPFIPDTSN